MTYFVAVVVAAVAVDIWVYVYSSHGLTTMPQEGLVNPQQQIQE
jgi:hypothetical protein